MKNKIVLILLAGALSLCTVGCNGEVTSVKEVEEVSGNTLSLGNPELKCDKTINEVVFNIVNEAYNNAKNMKHGTADISYMDENYNITSQVSITQDQTTDNMMLFYKETTDNTMSSYLYRYNYKGEDIITDVYMTTEYGWLQLEAVPPYNVDPLECFTFEDYTYCKVFEEPVSFFGEDESKDETKYYTLLSAGVTDAEGAENIVRYATTYISKEVLLPVATIIEYVDITSDVEVNIETNERVEDVKRTEVVLYTFNNDDVSDIVNMNPEMDEIIDEQTYLKKVAQAANESAASQEGNNE